MKWELPKEEKKFRDAGKLKIPDFGRKEEGPHLQDVGKLKWGGVSCLPKQSPTNICQENDMTAVLAL